MFQRRFKIFLGQKELKLVALRTLKYSRLTVYVIPATLLAGNKKKRECCLISTSLTSRYGNKREKSVIEKSGDTLNIDYRFLYVSVKLWKLKKI